MQRSCGNRRADQVAGVRGQDSSPERVAIYPDSDRVQNRRIERVPDKEAQLKGVRWEEGIHVRLSRDAPPKRCACGRLGGAESHNVRGLGVEPFVDLTSWPRGERWLRTFSNRAAGEERRPNGATLFGECPRRVA